MIEATGKPATTIAYFLRNVTSDQLGQQPVIIIDEASMISVVDMNAIVKRLPPAARMILVGDSFQLPPIGAGLVFHSLCRCEWIPRVELVEVKRQTESSGIPAVAKNIRDGKWRDLPRTGARTRLIPCDGRDIIDTVMDLYAEDPENTQILAATNKCRLAGVREINTRCQERFASSAKKLLVWNHEHDSWEDTGLREGDPIIYTRNDWARGLLNGSMGTLLRVYSPALDSGDAMACVARAEFEGVEIDVALSDIDYIEPSYAISVHKAQGSQFPRVIIAVRRSRILDRTWIYTSITRAQREFIIVGDRDATKQAAEEPPRAHLRVGF